MKRDDRTNDDVDEDDEGVAIDLDWNVAPMRTKPRSNDDVTVAVDSDDAMDAAAAIEHDEAAAVAAVLGHDDVARVMTAAADDAYVSELGGMKKLLLPLPQLPPLLLQLLLAFDDDGDVDVDVDVVVVVVVLVDPFFWRTIVMAVLVGVDVVMLDNCPYLHHQLHRSPVEHSA